MVPSKWCHFHEHMFRVIFYLQNKAKRVLKNVTSQAEFRKKKGLYNMGNLGQDTARLMGHTKITVPIPKGNVDY